jgi:hypothetical protein
MVIQPIKVIVKDIRQTAEITEHCCDQMDRLVGKIGLKFVAMNMIVCPFCTIPVTVLAPIVQEIEGDA